LFFNFFSRAIGCSPINHRFNSGRALFVVVVLAMIRTSASSFESSPEQQQQKTKKEGSTGVEPVTYRTAADCSTPELRTLYFLISFSS
jgi:hypothetical protein